MIDAGIWTEYKCMPYKALYTETSVMMTRGYGFERWGCGTVPESLCAPVSWELMLSVKFLSLLLPPRNVMDNCRLIFLTRSIRGGRGGRDDEEGRAATVQLPWNTHRDIPTCQLIGVPFDMLVDPNHFSNIFIIVLDQAAKWSQEPLNH